MLPTTLGTLSGSEGRYIQAIALLRAHQIVCRNNLTAIVYGQHEMTKIDWTERVFPSSPPIGDLTRDDMPLLRC